MCRPRAAGLKLFFQQLISATADEAAAIVDRFYQAYEDEVAAAPDGHAMDYIHLVLDIENRLK